MLQNSFCLWTRNLSVSQKTMQRHFISTLHPLSTVIFANCNSIGICTVCNSRFNFHCYTQHEATPTQKSAWKCAATSRDFFCKRLQSAFTLANQLRWIAQYMWSTLWCLSNCVLYMWSTLWCLSNCVLYRWSTLWCLSNCVLYMWSTLSLMSVELCYTGEAHCVWCQSNLCYNVKHTLLDVCQTVLSVWSALCVMSV